MEVKYLGRPAKNLIGCKFGKLTVIKRSDNREKEIEQKSAIWVCKCDCGNISEVRTSSLTSGKTKGCGCEVGGFIDLTGQKFGRLTVIGRGITNKNKKICWMCECECGNIVEIIGASLQNGTTKSCGCYKKEVLIDSYFLDITGQKFGRWTVLKMLENRKNTRIMWLCQCDCGTIRSVYGCHLRNGSSLSCGCIKTERLQQWNGENHPNWKGGITPLHLYLREGISKWKKDSIRVCKYKCVITKKTNKDLQIHHLHSFRLILEETLKILNMPIYNQIEQYSIDELRLLNKTCLELHYSYGLGVCLTKDLHKEFHKKYGNKNFTPEDFQEFYLLKTGKIYS